MAALLPFLEERRTRAQRHEHPNFGDLAAAVKGRVIKPDDLYQPEHPLSKSHTELTRLAWMRSLIAKALVGRSFEVELSGGEVWLRITPAIDVNTVPWSMLPPGGGGRTRMFRENSKMLCPTFDLPSGYAQLGGACPGAQFAQTTVPEQSRLSSGVGVAERAIGHRINKSTSICQYCYASGAGSYGYTSTQFAEVTTYAFIRSMMSNDGPYKGEGTQRLKDLLVWTIRHALPFEKVKDDPSTRHKIRPIRVHSSGDFFSTGYARMWMDVAREIQESDPDIRFWAPTRTWVLPSFQKLWSTPGFIPSNFSIRPSAYHVGDHAPEALAPGSSKGSSVLTIDESKLHLIGGKGVKGDGEYFDHQCGVYALDKGAKNCTKAMAPDGEPGCRACWINKDKAVNYAFH